MPSHDFFSLPTERTEYSDRIYSAIGRALTFAIQFEGNCRALAVLFGIRREASRLTPEFSLSNPEDLAALANKLSERQLFHHIDAICRGLRLAEEGQTILRKGREGRNALAHDFTFGIERQIETEEAQANILQDLSACVKDIALADLVICLLSLAATQNTHDACPYISLSSLF